MKLFCGSERKNNFYFASFPMNPIIFIWACTLRRQWGLYNPKVQGPKVHESSAVAFLVLCSVAHEPSQYLSILILFAQRQRHIYPNCWIKCPAKNRNTLVSEVYHQVVKTTWTQLEQLHIYLYFIFLPWHMPHDQNIPYWFPSLQKRNDPPWKR